jgi:hypothetical protein
LSSEKSTNGGPNSYDLQSNHRQIDCRIVCTIVLEMEHVLGMIKNTWNRLQIAYGTAHLGDASGTFSRWTRLNGLERSPSALPFTSCLTRCLKARSATVVYSTVL